MSRPRTIRPLRLAILVIACAAFPPGAAAQSERSPNDLRVENDRLKERIEELEGQLEASQRRVESLEQTIQRLREQLRDRAAPPPAEGGDTPPVEAERETAPTPAEPFAAPASMINSLRDNYREQFGGRTTTEGRERDLYIRDVRSWARNAARGGRGPIEWAVRVVDITNERGSRATFTIEVVDEASGLPIGQPFDLDLSGRNASRLRDGADDLWLLEGVLQSSIDVDESAATVSDAADPSMFLGPFAMYDFEVVIRSLREPN